MRFVVCVFVGLLMGAIGATTAVSIVRQRHAYPRALMTLLQHELGAARDAARLNTCSDNRRRLATLDMLASDIPRAIPQDRSSERVFVQYVDDLRKQIALTTVADCPTQIKALTDVANACDACHRDYR